MMLVTSCGGNKKDNGNFTPEEVALGDSLSVAYGEYQGARALSELKSMLPMMPKYKSDQFDKKEFLKAYELVMTTDSANFGYLMGLYQGLQQRAILDNEIGVPVDARKIVDAFAKVYNDTTISQEAIGKYEAAFRTLTEQVQEKMSKKEEAKAMESEEAKKNIADGEKYIAARMAEGYSKTESGLVYKIINPGDTTKVKEDDVIRLSYVGKHVNGEEFDSSKGEAQRFSVANSIPGFREGLTLLGKGGSAIIVIPADIAYGAMGRGPIGKMETLVFEINVADIE